MLWTELFIGALTLFVGLMGAYAKLAESSLKEKMEASDKALGERLSAHEKVDDSAHEKFDELEEKVYDHWEEDAKAYVFKKDFASFAKDVKESLNRIEDKLENLRDKD